jgi:hypothetical protein
VRKAAESGMRITQRSGRSNCLRYEKQMRELKATPREGKQLEKKGEASERGM